MKSRLYLLEHQSRDTIVDPPSHTGAPYTPRNNSSKSSCTSDTPHLSSLGVSSENSTLRQGSLTESRPTASHVNPLHETGSLWGRGTGGGVSDSEDTLDGMSVLSSSNSGDLNHGVCRVCSVCVCYMYVWCLWCSIEQVDHRLEFVNFWGEKILTNSGLLLNYISKLFCIIVQHV